MFNTAHEIIKRQKETPKDVPEEAKAADKDEQQTEEDKEVGSDS